jgi:hypothetical protein
MSLGDSLHRPGYDRNHLNVLMPVDVCRRHAKRCETSQLGLKFRDDLGLIEATRERAA